MRFGRVPKREKARILAAMQQSTQNRGQQRALASELDDQPRLLSAVLRAHLDTCEFTKEKVAAMRQRARDCPSYSMPTLLVSKKKYSLNYLIKINSFFKGKDIDNRLNFAGFKLVITLTIYLQKVNKVNMI